VKTSGGPIEFRVEKMRLSEDRTALEVNDCPGSGLIA
jgi:hypothetical protein